jgi:hypothetical protein
MKYKLTYRLTFLDYWHISSGISAGAQFDSSVIKDEDGIAYVSGKTIKGLAREMAETLFKNGSFVKKTFGEEGEKMGEAYFSNATLDTTTKEQIISNKLQDNLYDVIASTKIGQKDTKYEVEGIAVDNTLREIEVTIPMKLTGEILDIESQEDFEKLKKSLQMIKRMGLNRNRGLGRCKFSEIKIKEVS